MGRSVRVAAAPLEFEELLDLVCGLTPDLYPDESAFASDDDRLAA